MSDTALPKAYLLSEDDLWLIAYNTGVPIELLLESVSPPAKVDRVSQSLDIIDAFLERPLMFIGQQDNNTAITMYIELSCRFSHAARGFGFIDYCSCIEKMGCRGPGKLAQEHSRFDDMIVALRALHQRYLAWMRQHLYLFSFELEVPHFDPETHRDLIVTAIRNYLGHNSMQTEEQQSHIAYRGPYLTGGKPPQKIRVFLMEDAAQTIPNLCKAL